jgi:16S rRNA C1402 N4-methylase RsmH
MQDTKSSGRGHIPVMKEECLKGFEGRTLLSFYDATVGAGGHAAAFLEGHPEITAYLACDRDPAALEIAKQRLQPWQNKVIFHHGNFLDIDQCLHQYGVLSIDGFFLTWGFLPCSSIPGSGVLAF